MPRGDGANARSGHRDLADAFAAVDAVSPEVAAQRMCGSLRIPPTLRQINLEDSKRRLLCAPVELLVRQRKESPTDRRNFWLFSDVLVVGDSAAGDMQVRQVMPLGTILLQQTLWNADFPYFDLQAHRGKPTTADRLESLRLFLPPGDEFPKQFFGELAAGIELAETPFEQTGSGPQDGHEEEFSPVFTPFSESPKCVSCSASVKRAAMHGQRGHCYSCGSALCKSCWKLEFPLPGQTGDYDKTGLKVCRKYPDCLISNSRRSPGTARVSRSSPGGSRMLRLSSNAESFSEAAKNILGDSTVKNHPERVQTVVDVLREKMPSLTEIGDLLEDQIDEMSDKLELKATQAERLKKLWDDNSEKERFQSQVVNAKLKISIGNSAAKEIAYERQPVEIVERSMKLVPMEDREHDFFISHAQRTGQDQAISLHAVLKEMGYNVWQDMSAVELTATAMERGVRNAKCVLLFLSDGLMSRPFCNKELRWAQIYGCKIIGVVEEDDRHGKVDFAKERACAPEDLEHLLDDIEFESYQRRAHLRRAMLKKIIHDSNVDNSKDDETDEIPVPHKLGDEPSPHGSANSSASTFSVSRRVSVKVDEWIAEQREPREEAESEDELDMTDTMVQRRRVLSSFINDDDDDDDEEDEVAKSRSEPLPELRTEDDADAQQWHRSQLSSSSHKLSLRQQWTASGSGELLQQQLSSRYQGADGDAERAVEEAMSGSPEMTSAIDEQVYDITSELTADDPEDVIRAKTLLKMSVANDLSSPGSARSLA